MLEHLPTDALPRLVRRITLWALGVGAVGFVVTILIAPPLAALGLLVGLILAFVNLRFLLKKVASAETDDPPSMKVLRRRFGSNTSVRLGFLTAVVVVALFLWAPFAMGIVSGLVLYQIVFVVTVARVVAAQGGLK